MVLSAHRSTPKFGTAAVFPMFVFWHERHVQGEDEITVMTNELYSYIYTQELVEGRVDTLL